jgi:hypothetical protein
MGVAACSITTEPKSTATDANVFDEAEQYRAFLAKIYAGLAVTGQQGGAGDGDIIGFDEGFSHYVRLLWQMNELPTETAVIAWGDGSLQELNTMVWGSTNSFLTGMYNRVYLQVGWVNEFLRETTASKLSERGHTALADEIAGYRVEARFLRALSYWHGIDLFGDIPLVDESSPLGAEPPQQATRAQVFEFAVNELDEIYSELPIAGGNDYGRADQGAAAMLLAKLYMNAEVYTGSARYADALAETQKVIAGGYGLDPSYQHVFMADNHTSQEIIFPVPQDGEAQQSYGGTTFLIHASCGGSMNAADYGHGECWWGLRAGGPQLPGLFPTPEDSPDSRAMFYTTDTNIDVLNLTRFQDGWAVTKWSNLTSGGLIPPQSDYFATVDYPMFRLGDAYLMYAEAVLRGGGGDIGLAVDYVNALRERAYGDASGNITEIDLTLDFVLDERARELYWEGHRRMDLIRYGLFTGGDYLWQWKGGVQAGRSVEACFRLYPLPGAELAANPNLTQNDCY